MGRRLRASLANRKLMSSFHERLPNNVRGAFYVDCTCLDCDLCRDIAPANFSRDAEHGVSYVSRQPDTPEELARCREAVDGCPCESIGFDGDQHDWGTVPPYRWSHSSDNDAPRQCGCPPRQNDHGTTH